MSSLTRKLDEVRRLQTLYYEHCDSDQEWARRKAHLDLDRFLMENRETAIICIERVLAQELQAMKVAKPKKKSVIKRWFTGLAKPVDFDQ